MPTKLMMAFVGFDFLFAGCGGLLLGFSLMSEAAMQEKPTVANVTQNLLLGQCPLTAGVVNAIFIFVTFLLSLPALRRHKAATGCSRTRAIFFLETLPILWTKMPHAEPVPRPPARLRMFLLPFPPSILSLPCSHALCPICPVSSLSLRPSAVAVPVFAVA